MRQTSFNLEIKGDSDNNVTKFSGGFSFTLINDKDIKLKSLDNGDIKRLYAISVFMSVLKKALMSQIAKSHPKDLENTAINKAINDSWNFADKKNNFKTLHPFLQEALNDSLLSKNLESTPELNSIFSTDEIDGILAAITKGEDRFHSVYQTIAEKYTRKPLWTFSPTISYDRISKQGEYTFASDFTVGIGKDLSKKPWELEAKSLFTILNDSTLKTTNYKNKLLSASLGLNKVLLQTEEKESKMEFKLFTQYDYQFGNIPKDTDAGVFSLNSTLRINIFKSLWIPISIKYDPQHSNFFGYFSLTANLGN